MRTARLLIVFQHALHRGVSAQEGCLPKGGVCAVGVSAQGCLPRGGMADPTPVNRMTDRCRNINLPQLHCRQQKYHFLCLNHKVYNSQNVERRIKTYIFASSLESANSSILALCRFFKRWWGKIRILCELGFYANDLFGYARKH